MKIDLPIKVSTNTIYSGMHWTKRKKHKDLFLWACLGFKKLQPIDHKVNIHFDFYFKGRALDSSNCSYMAKMIEDCLTHYGVINDDTIKYIGRFSMESHKDKADYVVINITEL